MDAASSFLRYVSSPESGAGIFGFRLFCDTGVSRSSSILEYPLDESDASTPGLVYVNASMIPFLHVL